MTVEGAAAADRSDADGPLTVEEHVARACRPILEALVEMACGHDRRMRAALAEIRRNYREPGYRIEDLKRTVGASNWFGTEFRRAFGISLWRLVQECRMETATRLFPDTALPVTEVAFHVGYFAVPPFQRLCRRWCGLSPAGLRAALRRVEEPMRRLPEDVLSWRFWERFRACELTPEEVLPVIRYLEDCYGLRSGEPGER